MAYVLLSIILIGLLLIATEKVNRINKAAVAMFAGVFCWLLYIAQGSTFVLGEHSLDFSSFISANGMTTTSVKEFIADHIFLKYVEKSAEIVLFLIATTTIMEVLNNNGCFDFIRCWLRARSPRVLLWMITLISFVLSANVDNLATTILLLSIIHPMLQDGKAKRIIVANTVIAASCGGAVTVIGNMTSLKLWTESLVTPTQYFLTLIIPMLVCLGITTHLLATNLPHRTPYSECPPIYRGDDNLLHRWQRDLMLVLGIGGLWFIPTFHRITLMPPFVGALCVLALIWFVNELFNRTLMGSDKMVSKRMPLALQYANMQNILYFIGVVLMFGAFTETGLARQFCQFCMVRLQNVYLINLIMAGMATAFGDVCTLFGGVSIFTAWPPTPRFDTTALQPDGIFWPLLNYCTTIGGLLLSTSSIAGMVMMRMEDISFGWYFKHVTPKVLTGFLAGMVILTCMGYAMG